MRPTSSLKLGRRKIGPRGSNPDGLICLFCRLATTSSGPGSRNTNRRYSSTPLGSRGLHGGTPAQRPPSESQESPRPSWPVVEPQFNTSSINDFLKARKQEKDAAPIVNPFRVNQDALGKWARPTNIAQSNESAVPDFRPRSSEDKQVRFDSATKRNLRPAQARELPRTSTQNAKRKLPSSPSRATEPKIENPFEKILKSKKSATDIESDLFAGIKEVVDAPKAGSSTSPAKSSIDNILSNFSSPKLDGLSTSFTQKVNPPFRVSQEHVQKILESATSAGRTGASEVAATESDRPVQQFGFLAARQRPTASPSEKESVPIAIDDLGDVDDVKRVSSTAWRSASREQWTYEVEPDKEEEGKKEAEAITAFIEQETEVDEIKSKEQKKRELKKLKDRAVRARFRKNLNGLAEWVEPLQKEEAPLEITVQKELYIPPSISVANFASLMKMPLGNPIPDDKLILGTLQKKMELLGLEEEERAHDHILSDEMASLIAPEFGFEPHVDAQAAFDLFPQPMPTDASVPLRPPVVTIMGHVDHGKTTLLDTLRKSSVAANEAGGITQHIGAFSVRLSSGEEITFLDTPGHAAFLTMRERGANVTDIIVLVVAADDGVMPQTIEAINHAKNANVPIIVALNKCDREDANPQYVKTQLLEHGIELEEFGGEVQCVEVSGLTGKGLDNLEAAILTLSEVLEVKAPKDGLVEGWIIESTVDPGRGTYTTVLVKRGTLKTGDMIVAGTTYAKVRRMTTSTGKMVKKAGPGTAVEVTGWKERPDAGDMVLQAANESDAKLAIRNRIAKLEEKRDLEAVETLNEKRRAARRARWHERERKLVAEEVKRSGQSLPGMLKSDGDDFTQKEYRVLIKADVSGSAEAVEEAIKVLGNSEVKVAVIDATVGEITESDIQIAIAADAKILGFNIRALNPSLRPLATTHNVEVFHHTIIYKLIEDVISRLESQLKPKIEIRVAGEAEVSEIFMITIKGKKKPIAGSKVFNGVISMKEKCRITRNGKIVYTGHLDTLKHFKDDVKEVHKGMDCGLSFEGFDDLQVGDTIQSFSEFEVKRKLYG